MSTILLPHAADEAKLTVAQLGGPMAALGKVVSVWNAKDVARWLTEVAELPQYKENFLRNDIDGPSLLALTKKELQEEIGISSLGHRKALLKKIDELKEAEQRFANHDTVVLQHKIGSGSSAVVYSGYWRGQACAVKVVETDEIRPEVLRRVSAEIAILKSLQHPNVVSYYGHEEKDGQLRIYMEFVPKSLSQVITQRRNEKRPFTALEIKQIALGVAKGLDYLHTLARPIMHRDIKSKNVLVDTSAAGFTTVKLCDFGVSRVVEEQQAETRIGTVRFMAPEVLHGAYNKKADIWSFGMLLYEVVALEVPYRDEIPDEIYNKIMKGILPSLPSGLDLPTQRLIVPLMHRCLLPDPSARPAAREIVALLVKELPEKERDNHKDKEMADAPAAPPLMLLPTLTYPRSIGVVVSISQYASRELTPLPYAAADAALVELELRQRGFEVIVLAEERATKEGLEELLGETLKWRLGDNDRMVFFFAGHIEAVTVPATTEQEVYLLPYDCARGRAISKGVAVDRLAHFAKHLPCRHALFIIDACASAKVTHVSGDGEHNGQVLAFHARALHFMSAGCVGSPLPLTEPDKNGRQHTVFVQVLLEGLRGGAFTSSALFITSPTLAAWVQRTVAERTSFTTLPTFQRIGSGDGAVVFYPPAVLARSMTPADLLSVFLLSSAPLIQEEAMAQFGDGAYEYKREEEERRLLCDIFREARRPITFHFEFATAENIRKMASLSARPCIWHFDDHTPLSSNQIPLEDSNGDLSFCAVPELATFITAQPPLTLAIVTGRNAFQIGQAFMAAGVRHVIVCVLPPPSCSPLCAYFLQTLYPHLLSGEMTVQAAFDSAIAAVVEEAATADVSTFVLLPTGVSHTVVPFSACPQSADTLDSNGKLALVHAIPESNMPRSPLFIGRHKEMRQLLAALLSSPTRRTWLLGSSGVGKTSLASATGSFAIERGRFRDGVHYVNLENERLSAVSFAIAAALRRPVSGTAELLAECRQKEFVLILDNCDALLSDFGFEAFMQQLLSESPKVRVLLIARQLASNDVQNGAIVTLGGLPLADSVELLLRLAPSVPSLVQHAVAIAELVECLPVALNIIGRWITSGHAPESIVRMLNAKKLESNVAEMQLLEDSIASWFSELLVEEQAGLVALSIFPGTFDAEAAHCLLGNQHPAVARKFLRRLFADGMLEFDDMRQRYYLPAPVQLYLRKQAVRMPPVRHQAWAAMFLECFVNVLANANDLFLQGKETGLAIFDNERHNIRHALNIARSGGFPDLFCALVDAGKDVMSARLQPKERVVLYQDAVAFAARGGDRLLEASMATALGFAAERCADFPKAEEAYRHALQLREQILGHDHPAVADVLNHLGLLFSNACYPNNALEAGSLLARALAIREARLGLEHPDTAMSLNHMATYLRTAAGDIQGAEALYLKALDVLKSCLLEPDSAHAARVYNNLGLLYASTSREAEAESAFMRAMSIWRKSKHPDLSQTLNNLANLYKRQGKFAQAEMLYLESLDIRSRNGESLTVSQNLHNLGLLYAEQGQVEKAEQSLKRALEIREAFLGRDNQLFKRTFSKLHELYIATGKTRLAEELNSRCLNGRRLLASSTSGRTALLSSNSSSSTSLLDTTNSALLRRSSADVLRASSGSLRAMDTTPVMPTQPHDAAFERSEDALGTGTTSPPPGTLLSVIEQSAHEVTSSGTAPQPYRPAISSMPAPARRESVSMEPTALGLGRRDSSAGLVPPLVGRRDSFLGAPPAGRRRESVVIDPADLAQIESAVAAGVRPASPFTVPSAPSASMRPLLRRASVCAASVPEFVLQLDEQRRNSLVSSPPQQHTATQPDSRDSSPKRKYSLDEMPSAPSKRSSEPSLLRQVLSSAPSLGVRASMAVQNPSQYNHLPPVNGSQQVAVTYPFSLTNARRVSEAEPIDFHSWQPTQSVPPQPRTSLS